MHIRCRRRDAQILASDSEDFTRPQPHLDHDDPNIPEHRGRERLLHALNKDSGEMLLVAHGQERPKQDDYNRQRKPCWRH